MLKNLFCRFLDAAKCAHVMRVNPAVDCLAFLVAVQRDCNALSKICYTKQKKWTKVFVQVSWVQSKIQIILIVKAWKKSFKKFLKMNQSFHEMLFFFGLQKFQEDGEGTARKDSICLRQDVTWLAKELWETQQEAGLVYVARRFNGVLKNQNPTYSRLVMNVNWI